MPCDSQQLETLADCYICHSPATLQAIITFATAAEALALGYPGAVITINELSQQANCLVECIDERTTLAARAAIAVEKVNLAGAELGTNVETIVNAVRALQEQGGMVQLEAAYLCQMGQHEGP